MQAVRLCLHDERHHCADEERAHVRVILRGGLVADVRAWLREGGRLIAVGHIGLRAAAEEAFDLWATQLVCVEDEREEALAGQFPAAAATGASSPSM
jgi:hypothetical protein